MEIIQSWNWRLIVPKTIKMTLVRPPMTNFKMIRADCAVSSGSPLPQLIKALAHWLSVRGVGLWTVFSFWNKANFPFHWASLVAQLVKNPPAMQETQAWSLGQEDLLEKEMATPSSILAWRILWTEEPGGLLSMRSQRVRHDWVTNIFLSTNPACLLAFELWAARSHLSVTDWLLLFNCAVAVAELKSRHNNSNTTD